MRQHLAKRRARAIDLTQSKISGRRTGEYVADDHADKTAASEQRIGDMAPSSVAVIVPLILDLAVEVGALLVVSNDTDLLSMSPWRGTPIIEPTAFAAKVDAMRRHARRRRR